MRENISAAKYRLMPSPLFRKLLLHDLTDSRERSQKLALRLNLGAGRRPWVRNGSSRTCIFLECRRLLDCPPTLIIVHASPVRRHISCRSRHILLHTFAWGLHALTQLQWFARLKVDHTISEIKIAALCRLTIARNVMSIMFAHPLLPVQY